MNSLSHDRVLERFIRRQEVERRTGFGRSTIYAAIKPGSKRYDPTFPRPVRLSPGTIAWVESEVDGWIHARIAERVAPTT
ncbi:AlpA family phage regulatory protein [Stenotrophomonas maltophilia]|uniref:AlpA family phage regulatory protein n=1 Tax=Stenotrophomonas maltophilia TaxID=40324 RepID=A0ABD7C2H2_STEMA|nr:AlpA family phage regulatory protein [Stenotrophomonas maltophilia]QQQ42004.1 AlpA family phage regulatory protein [Stenotrophomonas maltophilia]